MSDARRFVFLAHAGPDKEPYVRPFARELRRRNISYWLDEAEIAWGDKITHEVNKGLTLSDLVVVFISPAFVGANYPEAELYAALGRENREGKKVVLPIVAGEPRKLLANYPLLVDKLFLHWDLGISRIADELQQLEERRWSLDELNQFVIDRVDLSAFPETDFWGKQYRLLENRTDAGEGPIFFWDTQRRTVERYWYDSEVVCAGVQPLTGDDIERLRRMLGTHVRE